MAYKDCSIRKVVGANELEIEYLGHGKRPTKTVVKIANHTPFPEARRKLPASAQSPKLRALMDEIGRLEKKSLEKLILASKGQRAKFRAVGPARGRAPTNKGPNRQKQANSGPNKKATAATMEALMGMDVDILIDGRYLNDFLILFNNYLQEELNEWIKQGGDPNKFLDAIKKKKYQSK